MMVVSLKFLPRPSRRSLLCSVRASVTAAFDLSLTFHLLALFVLPYLLAAIICCTLRVFVVEQ